MFKAVKGVKLLVEWTNFLTKTHENIITLHHHPTSISQIWSVGLLGVDAANIEHKLFIFKFRN